MTLPPAQSASHPIVADVRNALAGVCVHIDMEYASNLSTYSLDADEIVALKTSCIKNLYEATIRYMETELAPTRARISDHDKQGIETDISRILGAPYHIAAADSNDFLSVARFIHQSHAVSSPEDEECIAVCSAVRFE